MSGETVFSLTSAVIGMALVTVVPHLWNDALAHRKRLWEEKQLST